MGEAAKPLLFLRFPNPCNVILRGRRGASCLQKCRKPFCVAGAMLSRRCQKMSCIFPGRRSTLDTSIVILRDPRNSLKVCRYVFCENRIVKVASSGDNVQSA